MSLNALYALVALGIVVVVVPRLLRRFRGPTRPRLPVRGGVVHMRAPARYGIALGISALIPACVFAAMAIRLWRNGGTGTAGLVELAVVTLATLAVALHQFVAAFRQGFVVDEFGFTRVGVLTQKRLRWGDVERVVFNPMNRWFFVTAKDGSKVWVPVETHGIANFATVALARLPPASLRADELAREALDELAASDLE